MATRERVTVIAEVLAIGGLAFAVQQATSVPGRLLMLGVYVSVAGAIVALAAGGPRRAGWGRRALLIAALVSTVLAVLLGLFAVGLCGPTVLVMSCEA